MNQPRARHAGRVLRNAVIVLAALFVLATIGFVLAMTTTTDDPTDPPHVSTSISSG